MGIKKRTNKKYDYEPRYYKNEGEGSPFAMEQKFDKFRHTVGAHKGLKGNFSKAISELKDSKSRGANRIIVALVLLFSLIFLWIIDFDLSIFS